MFTTVLRDELLNHIKGTQPSTFSAYAGLITAITNWRTPTVTEANYTGYGTRPSITFGAIGDTSPAGGRYIDNSSAVTFPQNTGSDQDMIAWGLWNAATSGSLYGISLLDADEPIWSVVTDTTGDVFETAGSHGLSLDQRCFLLAAPGAPIPTGVSENTAYYVGTIPDTESLTLSTTASNGNPVAITAAGGCYVIPYTAVTVATNATPEFAANALTIEV